MFSAFQLEVDHSQIGKLWFDLTNEKVNLFNENVFAEFEQILQELENMPLKGLLILSAKKETFIAGADVNAFEKIDTYEKGWQAARRGQLLFQRLSRLPFPTIAVINGACMGGGTEMSLACTYRLATDHPKTRIGLPEVKLGIVPGWGGTQRLPKVVGLSAALKMILSGRPISAQKAYQIGLVDDLIAHQQMEKQALAFAQKVKANKRGTRVKKSFFEGMPFVRQFILSQAKNNVLKQTHGLYPAPLKAIEVIKKSWQLPIEKGLEIEAQALAELIITPQSKNLVWLFTTSEAIKKEVRKSFPLSKTPAYQKIGIIGYLPELNDFYLLLLRRGHQLHFFHPETDQTGGRSTLSIQKIKRMLEKQAHKKVNLNNITILNTPDALLQMDLIWCDTVLNDFWTGLKLKLPADVPVVINNAGRQPQLVKQFLKRSIAVNVMPWQRSSVVEIILSSFEDRQHLTRVIHWFLQLNRLPIINTKWPFGVVNTLAVIWLSEAVQFLEKYLPQQIDAALREFGWTLGPFKFVKKLDKRGLRSLFDSLSNTNQEGINFAQTFNLEVLFNKLSNPSFLTKKKKVSLSDRDKQEIQSRMNLLFINWAYYWAQKPGQPDEDQLDLLCVAALGFPPFLGGPLKFAKSQGLSSIAEQLQALEHRFGLRFKSHLPLKQ